MLERGLREQVLAEEACSHVGGFRTEQWSAPLELCAAGQGWLWGAGGGAWAWFCRWFAGSPGKEAEDLAKRVSSSVSPCAEPSGWALANVVVSPCGAQRTHDLLKETEGEP